MVIISSNKQQNPSQEIIKKLIDLYENGKLIQLIDETKEIINYFPNSLFLLNILGGACQKLRRFGEASKAFQKVVNINPYDFKGYNNLAVSLKDMNKLNEALLTIDKSLKINPNYAIAINNKGNILSDLGKIDRAIKQYKKAISIMPEYAEPYNNLGNIYQAKNNLIEAIKAYDSALLIKPNYKNAYLNKGNAQQKRGKFKQALSNYKMAIEIDPFFYEAYKNIGDIYQKLCEFKKAEHVYLKSISIKPNYVEAYYHLGKLLINQKKFHEAILKFCKVLLYEPNHENALNNIGICYLSLEDFSKATYYFEKAISINSNFAEPYNNIGNILQDEGKLDEAKIFYTKAFTINPNFSYPYNNIALIYEAKGKKEEAIKFYEKALKKNSSFCMAHRNLSRLIVYKLTDKQITIVKKLIKNPSLNDDDKSHLYYAYGKMNEDLGEYKIALDNYKIGGALRNKISRYDHDEEKALFSKIKISSSELIKNSLINHKIASIKKPIFILGMPRSGTTLVEQIISSHSKVFGGGELTYLNDYGRELAHGEETINKIKLDKLRKKYLLKIENISDHSSHITDKMPHNFRYISLILSIFPESKIIHVKRDASATCWSNFKHFFKHKSLNYSNDLTNTVEYFKLYRDLMKFWKELYGEQIFELDYDLLTIEQEDQTRKLINYIGLDWDKSCLTPHKNSRNIQTASNQQVRKKIYKNSSRSWKKFEPYLNGVFEGMT